MSTGAPSPSPAKKSGCNRFPGSRLRLKAELTEVTESIGGVQAVVTVPVTVELERSDKPERVAETISRFYEE